MTHEMGQTKTPAGAIIVTCSCGWKSTAIKVRKNGGHTFDLVRRAFRHHEAQEIVKTGVCPLCGEGLRRNNSIAGWWQCAQLGAEGFRKNVGLPSCSFQVFTE